MAHELTATDNVVLHRTKAWHGLGIVVEDAPTPREALTIAGLDWGVEQRTLTTQTLVVDPQTGKKKVVDVPVPGYIANYRTNNEGGELLGIVSESYCPIQNIEVADFCEALAEVSKTVKVETAGSMRGGKKVWFLCKAGSFEIGNGDENFEYLFVSNGHDGTTPYRFTPTSIRVVCSNTYHFAIGADDNYNSLGKSALVLKHTPNIKDKLEEARFALQQYSHIRVANIKTMQGLASKSATSDEFKQFFLECYTNDFGEIPTEAQIVSTLDKKEKRKLERVRQRSIDAYGSFSKRFDDEREIANASYWNAFNAYSGLIQHDRKARGSDDEDRIQRRADSNLFGLNQERTQRAMALACQKAFAV